MRFFGIVPLLHTVRIAACALAFLAPSTARAIELAPASPSPGPSVPAGAELPLIGHVRAETPFCHLVVDSASRLAENQLADIETVTEVLRILAYAPFDRDYFTERRGARALEVLAARLMDSRRGDTQLYVKRLRDAAKGSGGQGPRPDLAKFAAALDGAHSESSDVAHEIARALSVLDEDNLQFGFYTPDRQLYGDPRFARANAVVPSPVDATFERFSPAQDVENGPLHIYARSMAYQVSDSLERLLGSIDEARQLIPTAFAGCVETGNSGPADPQPSPLASTSP